MERAVVLLSGGLDSATCGAIAAEKEEIYALTIDYGSKHSKEIEAAGRIAKHLKAKEHKVMNVALDTFGGSALLDEKINIETVEDVEDIGRGIPTSYVPARNMIFLSIAVGYAEVVGATKVYIGANAVDYSGYPDCKPEFLEAFQEVVKVGTKAGVEGRGIRIIAPLIGMGKSDIIRKGMELGVPLELTWTCYRGGERACGTCEACILRLKGFREAGSDDPLEYER